MNLIPWKLLECDTIVVAGDVSNSAMKTKNWLEQQLILLEEYFDGTQPPILFVAGNHEYYETDMSEAYKIFRQLESAFPTSFYFLRKDRVPVEIGDAVFVGDTLWTDFELFQTKELSQHLAGQGMSDYACIEVDGKSLTPAMTSYFHVHAKAYLTAFALGVDKTKKLVVVTHHCPSSASIHPRYVHSNYSYLNPAFSSKILDPDHSSYSMTLATTAKLWIHGHTHESFDYVAADGCRVVCNPRGYSFRYSGNENDNYSTDKIVEI